MHPGCQFEYYIKASHQRPQKTAFMAHVLKNQSKDMSKNAHPGTLRLGSQPLAHTGSEFDDGRMLLPHSILGSLDDFRKYLVMRGETELVKQVPNSQRDPPSQVLRKNPSEEAQNKQDISLGHRNFQAKALQNWDAYIRQRRRQQNMLSGRLQRPVENLLMNRDYSFKEIQEQRELLRRVMPLIQSGYGHRVGSEFWSLPQHYGDEISGIRATLTQTERGKQKPVTLIRQPRSILQESGIACAEMLRPASQIWDPNTNLHRHRHIIKDLLRGIDINKTDFSRLEVIGSSKPAAKMCPSPLLEEVAVENKQSCKIETENVDPSTHCDDDQSDLSVIPALMFAGQLASWTGNSPSQQGEVRINTTVIFEALVGEQVSSQLKIHNVGSTAILFSWQKLPIPQSFSNLQSQSNSPHFYFNTSSGVIYPGGTQQIEFIFKSERPGLLTERWQLNTHPLLLQGASIQVTLKGVSLYQDTTEKQREFIQQKLEETVSQEICQMIMYDVLRGIRTPVRCNSPAEPFKFQYLDQSEEELKKLLQEMNPERIWQPSESPTQDEPQVDDQMDSLRVSVDKFNDGDDQDTYCDDTIDTDD
ncbi:MYCBP-associated protein isoform X2 [Dunckerocampus dactyliophorus]|uniref:MYCBP-associated protein isoform X2 n=1 Tax=Dunckerocampus dactyliophorus TaxID=161453 RepID=UPI00240626F3|nr:MYCBP-associated protein isoform X2 [Dunckerocampus dactyliophorus]